MHKVDDEPEPIRFRSTVKQLGWARVYHVLTLDKELSDGAFRLYALLLKYARQSGGCWPGVERLARDLDKAKSTIKARLAELTERGLITRERRLGTSSVTGIEDLERVYGRPESRTTEQVFEGPENQTTKGQTIGRHEKHPDKNMQQGDDDSSSEQHTITSLLTDFGVDTVVARRLARECTTDQVLGWIAYTSHKWKDLHKPVAFLVSRLQSGEPAPLENNDSDQHTNRRRHTEWGTSSMIDRCKCGIMVPKGYLCPDCGRYSHCCECEDLPR